MKKHGHFLAKKCVKMIFFKTLRMQLQLKTSNIIKYKLLAKFYEKQGELVQNVNFWVKMDVFGPKWAIFDNFFPGMAKTGFVWEKAKMSLSYAYYAATLCKKPEQTYERILRSSSEERTNGQTNGQTNGRTRVNSQVPIPLHGRPTIG